MNLSASGVLQWKRYAYRVECRSRRCVILQGENASLEVKQLIARAHNLLLGDQGCQIDGSRRSTYAEV